MPYTFSILMYVDDELVGTHMEKNRESGRGGSFVREFNVAKLEEIGRRCSFVVIDSSNYRPGMRPLGLLAWPNSADTPVRIRFDTNVTNNVSLRRRSFVIEQFKSCVFEFDDGYMNSSLL